MAEAFLVARPRARSADQHDGRERAGPFGDAERAGERHARCGTREAHLFQPIGTRAGGDRVFLRPLRGRQRRRRPGHPRQRERHRRALAPRADPCLLPGVPGAGEAAADLGDPEAEVAGVRDDLVGRQHEAALVRTFQPRVVAAGGVLRHVHDDVQLSAEQPVPVAGRFFGRGAGGERRGQRQQACGDERLHAGCLQEDSPCSGNAGAASFRKRRASAGRAWRLAPSCTCLSRGESAADRGR